MRIESRQVAYKCDACGNQNVNVPFDGQGSLKLVHTSQSAMASQGTLDLCPPCLKLVTDFWATLVTGKKRPYTPPAPPATPQGGSPR